MQNEGGNGGEQDLESQQKTDEEGSSVVGCRDESNQTLLTIVISSGEPHDEQCRICQEEKQEALIDLGCRCQGGIAKAHRPCIDTWFRSRGSNRCEICQEVAANVPPPESQPSTNSLVRSFDPTFGSHDYERVCFWVTFSILFVGLILDVLISIWLGTSALPGNIIIGVFMLFVLGIFVSGSFS